MTIEAKTFEGWAIVELMGHVRLAGRVSPAPMFGTELLRIDIPNGCTGVTASWCPIHGSCKCDVESGHRDDPSCPLHSRTSAHEEGYTTQFVSGASLYRLTPVSEEAARAVAIERVPPPVSAWEIRRLEAPKTVATSVIEPCACEGLDEADEIAHGPQHRPECARYADAYESDIFVGDPRD